jgi:hypothetical protein
MWTHRMSLMESIETSKNEYFCAYACLISIAVSSAELVSLSGLPKPLLACYCLSKCGTCRGELLALYAILNSCDPMFV